MTGALAFLLSAGAFTLFPIAAARLVGAIQRGPARKTMTTKTYELKTLHDLLQVPPARRADMLSEVEQAMLTYELMAAIDPASVAAFSMIWTDDGCRDTVVTDPGGAPVLTLKVKQPENTTGQPAAQEAGAMGDPLNTDRSSTYTTDAETAALLALSKTKTKTETIHTQLHGEATLAVRSVIDEPHDAAGQFYLAETDLHNTDEHPLKFHRGNPAEVGFNGWTNEALLAVLIHRTQVLDAQFPCVENKRAVDCMKEAKQWFDARAHNRRTRGVAGKQEA